MESELELDPKAQNPSIQSLHLEALPFVSMKMLGLWLWLCFYAMSLSHSHCSRQKFFGFKVALDDEGTAEGWLFWDDGQSIGE